MAIIGFGVAVSPTVRSQAAIDWLLGLELNIYTSA
jgi:hypothetical protein